MSDSIPTSLPDQMMPALSARERVVDLLQLRFADDRLSLEEFERRVALAYRTTTIAELDALVADLAPNVTPDLTPGVTPDGPAAPPTARILTILSNNERSGSMLLPQRLEIVTVMGNVELDIRDATFAPGLTEIDISAALGNVEITLPWGIRVESTGSAFVGNFDCRAGSDTSVTARTGQMIRITGHSVFSSVEISSAPPGPLELEAHAARRLT